jgi:uncharacterized protein with von Willebrand factor type A (vWA) domain
MAEAAGPRARPLEAIAGFAAHLRDHGFRVGVAEQQAMLKITLAIEVAAYRRLEPCWRALVCGGADEWHRYPELFRRYWFPETAKGGVRVSGETRPRRDLRQMVADLRSAATGDAPKAGKWDTAWGTGGDGGAATTAVAAEFARGGASRAEPLERRGFPDWGTEETDRLERLVEAVARRLRTRLTRRRRFDPRGNALDLRKTLRRSLRTGGVPFEPAWLKRRRERPRLFILVDVSRSMELYARLFLRVARAFAAALKARVFVFHTRLAEITPLLQRPGGRVQEKINAVTAGFGGGTRIATSLADFVHVHARGALSRSARVLILSDGFDSDGETELARQLEAIKSRGAAIYWLHPSREPPQASALAPCAGLIAAFAPVHDLASLARLEDILN